MSMKMSFICMLLLFPIGFISCKSGKDTGNGTNSSQTNQTSDTAVKTGQIGNVTEMVKTESWSREQANAGPDSFRLVVTFISIGAGTDPDGKAFLDNYILDFKKRSGKNISYIMIPWGREGEVDCCFTLSELSISEQTDFIEQLRRVMTGRELIQINENFKNRFKP